MWSPNLTTSGHGFEPSVSSEQVDSAFSSLIAITFFIICHVVAYELSLDANLEHQIHFGCVKIVEQRFDIDGGPPTGTAFRFWISSKSPWPVVAPK